MSEKKQSSGVDRITAAPGSEEYERQFQRQRTVAIQRIAKMPLVRVVCGVLTLIYLIVIVMASFFVVKSQLESGFQAWDVLAHAGTVLVMWWLISMQGRIALYGEFGTG